MGQKRENFLTAIWQYKPITLEVLYPLSSNLNSMTTSKRNNQRCRHADTHAKKILITIMFVTVKNLTAAYVFNKKIDNLDDSSI